MEFGVFYDKSVTLPWAKGSLIASFIIPMWEHLLPKTEGFWPKFQTGT